MPNETVRCLTGPKAPAPARSHARRWRVHATSSEMAIFGETLYTQLGEEASRGVSLISKLVK